jgi:hypothetical protein
VLGLDPSLSILGLANLTAVCRLVAGWEAHELPVTDWACPPNGILQSIPPLANVP